MKNKINQLEEVLILVGYSLDTADWSKTYKYEFKRKEKSLFIIKHIFIDLWELKYDMQKATDEYV